MSERPGDATVVKFEQLRPHLEQVAVAARSAAHELLRCDAASRNAALIQASSALKENQKAILRANGLDMKEATKQQLAEPLLDRLQLTESRFASMVEGLCEVAEQPDPLGTVGEAKQQVSGIRVATMQVPMGVIAMIYESRPNVTADAAGLCLKAGNACILHGGKEARHSNAAIIEGMKLGLQRAGLPETAVQSLLPERDQGRLPASFRHLAVRWLLGAEEWVDLAIPRGGKNLGTAISEYARVPVLKHLEGICHLYVHRDADLKMAEELSYNAKCYRYSICGAAETLLVDREVAEKLLPRLAKGFVERGVELRGCDQSRRHVPSMAVASEADWTAEYLGPTLAVKVVSGLDEAIAHINRYGTAHTDSIITENQEAAQRFFREVDSSSVMHNVPTNFADGKEYGLGAEIGISTGKLHARGPIGAGGLTSSKFIVTGSGQQRS